MSIDDGTYPILKFSTLEDWVDSDQEAGLRGTVLYTAVPGYQYLDCMVKDTISSASNFLCSGLDSADT
eukprot:SAG31_NODE_18091_length_647_cov_1.056569_1_plen_68_part_00